MENRPLLPAQTTPLARIISSLKRSLRWCPSWRIQRSPRLSRRARQTTRQIFRRGPSLAHLWKNDRQPLAQDKRAKDRSICWQLATWNQIKNKVIYQGDDLNKALSMAETRKADRLAKAVGKTRQEARWAPTVTSSQMRTLCTRRSSRRMLRVGMRAPKQREVTTI